MARNRRIQIREEATRLFGEYGFDRVTIRELADCCGITEPAVYRYFSSKEAIYNDVLESLRSRLDHDTIFAQLRDEDDLEKILYGLANHILDFYLENTEPYRLLLYSALRHDEKARSVFRAIRSPYVEFLTGKLDDLHAKGLICKKNNEITARCFIGTVFDCSLGATIWKGFHGRLYRPRDLLDNNIPIYVKGLRAEN
jgi:AcrR family transcriptional regulator